MDAKDYLKSKKIWLGTKVVDMNAPESYFELEHLLEDYHEHKLKLLSIADVVGRSEQLTCPHCKSTNILNPDKDNDAQCIECAFIWTG